MDEAKEEDKVLLVGGTSSLALPLMKLALQEGNQVFRTTRRPCDSRLLNSERDVLLLDISSQSSIENFLTSSSGNFFNRIFILVGSLSKNHVTEINYSTFEKYMTTYSTNLCYLTHRLLEMLSPRSLASLVFVSSRAASRKSYDFLYSASKSSVSAFIKSRSLTLPKNHSAVSIESGLIVGSTMYEQMPDEVDRHQLLSGNRLLTVDEFVQFIWSLDQVILNKRNGEVINVGPIY